MPSRTPLSTVRISVGDTNSFKILTNAFWNLIFFSSESWKCVVFNHGTNYFFECILATGFLFEIQQSKKQLFILTAFSRSEISKMTVRCSNNGEFLHQKVPLNTQWKIFSPRLIWKNLSNIAINFFLQKKATDWIYIMFYPQMSNFSEQNFTTETFLRSLVWAYTAKSVCYVLETCKFAFSQFLSATFSSKRFK